MGKITLTNAGSSEQILSVSRMPLDDTFEPGLQGVGRLFGVHIEFSPESGFTLDYLVRPPIPQKKLHAFSEIVMAITVDAHSGASFPSIYFEAEQPSGRAQIIYRSNDLVA